MAAVVVAAVFSTGGHASVDSIQQLYEGQIGRSITWNPPFMSALLMLLGNTPEHGAGLAMPLFVALVCISMWGGLLLAARPVGGAILSWWRVLLSAALLWNPVLLIYAGIVWKDVLFGALCTLAGGLGLVAIASPGRWPRVLAILAVAAVVGLLPLVRQQGILLGPVLLLLPLLAVWTFPGWSRRARLAGLAVVVLVAAGTRLSADAWSHAHIPGNDGRAMSVGFKLIFSFDLVGIEANTLHGPLVELGAPDEVLREVRDHYTPERVDFFDRTPKLSVFLSQHREQLPALWAKAVAEHPAAYLTHRAQVMASLLAWGRERSCLHIHVGIDGIPAQLEALGLSAGTDVADRVLYQWSIGPFLTPVMKHWPYVLALVVLGGIAMAKRRGATRIGLGIVALAAATLYASLVPTAIACDFRYAFAAIPLTTVVALALLAGWRAHEGGHP